MGEQRAARLSVRELGHVSLFVRDLDATRRFYRDLLGLTETGTAKDGRIVFFSAGRHHHDVSCELARVQDATVRPKGTPGLYHLAFDVGDALDDLAAARRWVESHGLAPFGETRTGFCVRDPDGHEVELYVEVGRSSAHEQRHARHEQQREDDAAKADLVDAAEERHACEHAGESRQREDRAEP
jgi:catechol 2,3-dioxygenase-like lactoylglutathione lyase family enzyme